MKLYHIQYEDLSYFVEAPNLGCAVEVWRVHVKNEWGDDYDGTEEPESIALVHDEPVIREAGRTARDAELVTLLKEVEWAGRTWADTLTCPWCRGLHPSEPPPAPGRPEDRGHRPDCRFVEVAAGKTREEVKRGDV